MGMGPSRTGPKWEWAQVRMGLDGTHVTQESASKFLSEFELVRVVGRGAFGKVMRRDAMRCPSMGLLRVIDPACAASAFAIGALL